MAKNIRYVLVDSETGFDHERLSVPASLFPPAEISEGLRLVVPLDNHVPLGTIHFDLEKIPDQVNEVATISSVQSGWQPRPISESHALHIDQRLFEEQRRQALTRTNAAAEEARLRHITKGDGQMLTYTRKYEQALAFLANQEIDEAAIPAVMNEVGLTAPTKYQVAQVIVNKRAMWEPLDDYIEKHRLTASYAIAAATNPAEIEGAEAALAAALAEIS